MKIRYKKKDIHKWHKKFAWLPTKVDDTENEQTVVWFESYMRKHYKYIASSKSNKWHKFSKKEYFKRQLARDLPGEIYADAACETSNDSPSPAPSPKTVVSQIKNLQAQHKSHNQ